MGIDLLVPERDEAEDSVRNLRFLRGRRIRGAGGLPSGGDAHFIFEFNDDPLSSFFADPFHLGQRFGVSGNDRGFEIRDRAATEDIERDLRSDAGDILYEQPEKITFARSHETIEDVGVFPDVKVGENFYLRTGRRQSIVAGKRDEHMITDPVHGDDDMRRQRLGERTLQKGDHRRNWRTVSHGWEVFFAAIFFCVRSSCAEAVDEEEWRIFLEPKFMHAQVGAQIAEARQTEIVAGRRAADALAPMARSEFDALKLEWRDFVERTQAGAEADLAKLKPQYVRDRKGVIEYAVLESGEPLAASAVLAPSFLGRFAETLGPKILVVVPNQFTAYVFPALASNYQRYAHLVVPAFRSTAHSVSLEVVEISPEGMRAVGVFKEP